jgi:hypothetical protein
MKNDAQHATYFVQVTTPDPAAYITVDLYQQTIRFKDNLLDEISNCLNLLKPSGNFTYHQV